MTQHDETTRIKALLAGQVEAIRNRNIAAATKNYAQDVLIFDVVGPLSHPKGVGSVEDRLNQWLSTFADDATINFELVDLAITAHDHLAFSHSYNHINASLKNGSTLDMYWRETLGWRKENSEWKIVHAHSSVPFDPATGKASTGLKP
jgi:uncharacterized protein (TIGR02246 family)